jgi:hypothetical protein
MATTIGEGLMTPEQRQDVHEKTVRLLDSDQRELLIALVNVLYESLMKERERKKASGTAIGQETEGAAEP